MVEHPVYDAKLKFYIILQSYRFSVLLPSLVSTQAICLSGSLTLPTHWLPGGDKYQ